ncbi:MAG: ABC transporter permease [Euryarchaeota archaeon]|nr:ABC transporter permease [Euryarchaeota archaeon]
MLSVISGFLSIVYNETRRLIKSFLISYVWFAVLVLISTYALFAEKYVDLSIDGALMAFKYVDNPMTDVLSYIVSFAATSSSEVMSGNVPTLVFPVSIGVIFFILVPLMLSLTFIGNQIIKKASTTIAGEDEKKTLFIMASSPQTRQSIYIGKFIGLILLTIPMIIFFYFITDRVFTSLFSPAYNVGILVMKLLFINAVLFASAGMFVSVLFKNEKKASWAGTRIVTVAATLTSIWIMIPFIDFMLNLTNNSMDFLIYLEKLTWLSPFTLGLMAVYNPSVFAGYFNILIAASVILFLIGMVTFIKQDLEY